MLNSHTQRYSNLVRLILLVIAMCLFIQAGWIHAKAKVAQLLIHQAWQKQLSMPNASFAPWPWADMHPVARLQLPSGDDWIVLSGAQGESLAFGPGHLVSTNTPGNGFSVIGGHRDTHFHSLKNISIGQEIRLQTQQGLWQHYRIKSVDIVNIKHSPLLSELEHQLVLVTCYPFHGVQSNTQQRFVVRAVPIPSGLT